MAKTDWQMNDTVLPDDMNQIGQEINDAATAAANAQDAADAAAALQKLVRHQQARADLRRPLSRQPMALRAA